MIKIFIGILIGIAITLAAVNPDVAKNAAGKAVDTVHGAYKNGVSVNTNETKLPPEVQSVLDADIADLKKKYAQHLAPTAQDKE